MAANLMALGTVPAGGGRRRPRARSTTPDGRFGSADASFELLRHTVGSGANGGQAPDPAFRTRLRSLSRGRSSSSTTRTMPPRLRDSL